MAIEVGATPGEKGRPRPEMNVTPLVDVVLVLLIIFMVVTPMMNEQFWLNVPQEQKNQEPASADADALAPIVVSVNQLGQIQINQDVIADAHFPTRLRRMLVARGERRIYFDAHNDSPFERTVHAMDLARGAGAAHIAVVTQGLQ